MNEKDKIGDLQNNTEKDNSEIPEAPKGCEGQYFELEECLGEHDRDWRFCQAQVASLRACFMQQRAGK